MEKKINLTSKTRLSLTDEAYTRIKKEILENKMPPGTQSLELELAQRMKMSRTPVREAIVKLQEEGFVEIIPRRGMRVKSISPADMHEIYEVLTCVESEAAVLITQKRPSKKELKLIEKATNDMEKAIKKDDLEAWADADNRYHRELLGICPNQRLAGIASMYMDLAHRARMFTLRLREKPVRSTLDHKEQLAAIIAGDVEHVYKIFRSHRERATEEMIKILKEYKLYYV